MIDRLLDFFGLSEEEVSSDVDEVRVQHATAVLLVEIARADHERLAVEHDAMLGLLQVGSFETFMQWMVGAVLLQLVTATLLLLDGRS